MAERLDSTDLGRARHFPRCSMRLAVTCGQAPPTSKKCSQWHSPEAVACRSTKAPQIAHKPSLISCTSAQLEEHNAISHSQAYKMLDLRVRLNLLCMRGPPSDHLAATNTEACDQATSAHHPPHSTSQPSAHRLVLHEARAPELTSSCRSLPLPSRRNSPGVAPNESHVSTTQVWLLCGE